MFKETINILKLFFITCITCTFFIADTYSQENKPKSMVEGYKDGGSIFTMPVFEPSKIDIDINSKYKREYAYPKVDISKKPGTKTTPKSQITSSEKPLPKSMKEDYSGGFIIKKKVESKIGFIEKEEPETEEIMEVNSRVIPYKPQTTKPYKPKRKPVIVIDPGHGGKDPGAIGRLGTKEKQITFLYSTSLKTELERSGKYKVILTRYGDNYVSLNNRVNKARKFGGDILISIHADSIADRDVRGFSVYTISDRRVQREAGKLLEKADREEVIRGVEMRGQSDDVQEAIIDFAQKETKSISDDLSKIVAKHLGQKVKPLKRTNREGSLAVLTGADIPSVLIELGYLSNKYEETMLRTKDHRIKIVNSLKSAIDEYFEKFDFFLE